MANENDKRIHITSTFSSDTDTFYERIENKDTGDVETKENKKPSTVTSKTTVTTNPYHHETEISPNSKKNRDPASQLASKKQGYDASEL
jgi:hypothetical protein